MSFSRPSYFDSTLKIPLEMPQSMARQACLAFRQELEKHSLGFEKDKNPDMVQKIQQTHCELPEDELRFMEWKIINFFRPLLQEQKQDIQRFWEITPEIQKGFQPIKIPLETLYAAFYDKKFPFFQLGQKGYIYFYFIYRDGGFYLEDIEIKSGTQN